MTIKRALFSVSDKSGLIELAKTLANCNIEIISTGGTSKALSAEGIAVQDVADITHFPEIMDGRVKTLHPKIHGGLLNVRGNTAHEAAKIKHDIANIDLLIVNLYPFEETLERGGTTSEIIENIDIGGPAMIRSAAKNHEHVAVVVDPSDYATISAEILKFGTTTLETRKLLAAKAFARTASYDAAIANWFNQTNNIKTPSHFVIAGKLAQGLRYGENPHQSAAAYKTADGRNGILQATQVQGKELSYNNINDADAALETLRALDQNFAACVIVKHANPCGVAYGATLEEAYAKALACDPISAFGGILAFNQKLDSKTAREIAKLFTEVIITPAIDDDAKTILFEKKNLRLLILPEMAGKIANLPMVKSIAGGMLVQSADEAEATEFKVVTKRQPTSQEMQDLVFAWKIAKHVKSNAIVFAKDQATLGIGAGQMSRIDSTHIAIRKAGEAKFNLTGSALASDAFFPFADTLLAAADAGATAIIQPGGAMRDDDVISAADEHGLAMIFTGLRHFKH